MITLSQEDENLLNNLQIERHVSNKTIQGYRATVKHYVKYCGLGLTELFEEADTEEEQRIRMKKRTIKKRLMGFRSYLYDNYAPGSAKHIFGQIMSLYNHYEYELPTLPKISTKQYSQTNKVSFNDLLTKDEIRDAVNLFPYVMRAYTLFAVSTGCARKEALSVTVDDYFKTVGINSFYELGDTDVGKVCSFKLHRYKTNKDYFTFCTPEASKMIKEYLLNRGNDGYLNEDEKLFDLNFYYLNKYCSGINEALNLGKTGNYNRFRSHMLRKFHASQLYNHGVSLDVVDALQGRGKDVTHSSYFMEDPNQLKEQYIEVMDAVTIGGVII